MASLDNLAQNTLQENVDLYNDAVTAIRDIMSGGQKVVVGDREFEAAKIADIEKVRDTAWAAIQSAQGGMFRRATFGRVT